MEENKQYKIKIDLAQGIFEAEGSEQFVNSNLERFKEIVAKRETVLSDNKNITDVNNSNNEIKKRVAKTSAMPSLVKDLNLKPKDKKSLNDFYQEKNPRSNIENNVVFVYYMEKILNILGITLDHIYSCYKEIGLKTPLNLRQSIADTASNRYGYLDASDMQNIKIIVRGDNLIEHDLPKKA